MAEDSLLSDELLRELTVTHSLHTTHLISMDALMLGLAIAFGICGGVIATRILEHQFPERERSSADEMPHL